jgi:mRNA interferase RelE/StbE
VNSGYKIVYSSEAGRQLRKMERQVVKRILSWVDDRLLGCPNPRLWGAALVGGFSGFWKYRMGDYRLVCEIKDEQLTILIIDVGNRKEVYRN